MQPDKLISDARARIIWGESPATVRADLVANGVFDVVTDAKIKEFVLERNAEIRRIGIRNVLIGVVLVAVASLTIWLALPPLTIGLTRGYNLALGMTMVAGGYGLWKLVKGIIYLVRPQSQHKSTADIAESDFIE